MGEDRGLGDEDRGVGVEDRGVGGEGRRVGEGRELLLKQRLC